MFKHDLSLHATSRTQYGHGLSKRCSLRHLKNCVAGGEREYLSGLIWKHMDGTMQMEDVLGWSVLVGAIINRAISATRVVVHDYFLCQ